MTDTVLLTGISGFIGGHVALALLNAGYTVRGSVRTLERSAKMRETLSRAGADTSRLEFVTLDLQRDEGWSEAMAGCRYLQHTASPFPASMPKNRDDLVRPAVDGTRRAIAAALGAGAERIVLTSSIAAIQYGHPDRQKLLGEKDWTDLTSAEISAYTESKTRAEREAWSLMERAGRTSDLAVINPGFVLGPLLDEDPGTSATLVQTLLKGVPAVPRISLGCVDVRDVALAHLNAMNSPVAGGRRFLLTAGSASMLRISDVLRQAFPDRASRLPRLQIPDWLVRVAALFSATARNGLSEIGTARRLDGSTGSALLGRPNIPVSDTVVATARSLIEQGLV